VKIRLPFEFAVGTPDLPSGIGVPLLPSLEEAKSNEAYRKMMPRLVSYSVKQTQKAEGGILVNNAGSFSIKFALLSVVG